ncbi:MAG TPA: porin [Limnobacter sp.]|nr:porin [Limnobacter sp.]
MISKKLVAASILAAMGTSAHAIGFKAGDWEMDISGSINAYYTSTSCDSFGSGGAGLVTANATALNVCGSIGTAGQDSNNVQNGLLPGFIIFTAKTKQNGYDISGTISIDPGTSNDNGLTSGGRGQLVGDNRRVFLTFGNSEMGTFKFGRDIGLFGQNAILNDMSLVAVGGGAGTNGGINTTLGGIGQGYIYTQFQPQITYTTPDLGGLSLSGGVFQPIQGTTAIGANGSRDAGFQGLASYSLGSTGKMWAAMVQQSRDTTANQSDITGFEVGTALNFGALGLTGNYFSGEGLGTALIGLGGADAQGQERDSQGYMLQATYKVGNTKFGVNYGVSSLDATANDTNTANGILDENQQLVLGVYHNLTPSLIIAGEYINNTMKFQRTTATAIDAESDTIAIGAILFF